MKKTCGTCIWYEQGEIFGICTNEESNKRNKNTTLKLDHCKRWERKKEINKRW